MNCVRTQASIPRLPKIAIHAEHLKTWRIALPLKPLVKVASLDRASMVRSIVVDVIER
jgi:hypothetical protein